MTRIAVVVGSTRPGRRGRQVADWVLGRARQNPDAEFEILDLADFGLPLLDEPLPPSRGRYEHEHTKAWARAVAPFDGFVFVTGEYNHSVPGALKNALDYLYAEWNNKSAGFVGYGSAGGVRAVENLRLIAGELQMADVRAQVVLPFATEFQDYTTFTPSPAAEDQLTTMLGQVIAWAAALQPSGAEQRPRDTPTGTEEPAPPEGAPPARGRGGAARRVPSRPPCAWRRSRSPVHA